MRNLYKKILLLAFGLVVTYSCTERDTIVDQVLDGVTNGAVLRGDNTTFEGTIVLDVPEASRFFLDIEEQDNQDGELLESVDVFVTFAEDSPIAGDASGANTAEVMAFNIPAEDFTPDEFGLPETSIEIPLSQLLSLVSLSSDQQIYIGDTWTVRLALNLTDGRVFTVSNATGIIQGGFFNSPFQYICNVSGGLIPSFSEEGTNEINIVPGADNAGYSADVTIDEYVDGLFASMEIYGKYVDNNEDDPDLNTMEVLMGTFDRSEFTLDVDEDGEPVLGDQNGVQTLTTSVSFDLAEVSQGVDIADMTAGDAVELRYALINSAGREITDTADPYVQVVPVTSCPVGPLADSGAFVGDYELEHTVTGIFGYNTFGNGEVVTLFADVTDASQNSPGVVLTATQRSFDATYLQELGSGLFHTYIAEFNCQNVTFVDNAAPIGNFTGWACGGVSIYAGSQVGGGSFDVADDSEFTLGFTDDVQDACGLGSPAAAVKFIKQ